jgi:hypothetical protein
MQQDCWRGAPPGDPSQEILMARQLLHLVFGGELKDPGGTEFVDTEKLDLVGIYPNYKAAHAAWQAAAHRTVDDAHMRYFVVHLHRLLDPEATGQP